MDNNKPKLLIHIGYHKTATTFFQKQLFSSEQFNLLDRLLVQNKILEPSPYGFDEDALNSWLEDILIADKINVISEEELSGNIHCSGGGRSITYEMAERLAKIHVADVQIIIMLREQRSMVESCYRQYVKKGGTFSFNNYFDSSKTGCRRFRFQGFSLEHFKYDDVVEHYQKNFGSKKIHCFLYEQFIDDKKKFLSKLKQLIGFEKNIEQINLHKKENSGLSNWSILCARLSNRFTVKDPISRQYICYIPGLRNILIKFYLMIDRCLPRSVIFKKYLTSEADNMLENYYLESNNHLVQLTALNLKKYGYSVTSENADQVE